MLGPLLINDVDACGSFSKELVGNQASQRCLIESTTLLFHFQMLSDINLVSEIWFGTALHRVFILYKLWKHLLGKEASSFTGYSPSLQRFFCISYRELQWVWFFSNSAKKKMVFKLFFNIFQYRTFKRICDHWAFKGL